MTAWRKRQVFKKINTYEGRPLGVHTGEVNQIFRPAWMCTICKRIFFLKEETETHKHNEQSEGDK